MMNEIRYKIQFYSPWHCGSGLSAGSNVDELVIKDRNRLPYIPGKTMKGLIREALEDYAALSGRSLDKDIMETLGIETDTDEVGSIVSGTAFFSNAVLCQSEADAIIASKAQSFLFREVVSTSIDENGIAVDHSLRAIETVVPCTLHASVTGLPDSLSEIFGKALGMIHHIGMNRNRGLGRCDLIVEKGGEK